MGINIANSDRNENPFTIFAGQDKDERLKIEETNSDKLLGDGGKSLDFLLDQPENQAGTRKQSIFNAIFDNIAKTPQKTK